LRGVLELGLVDAHGAPSIASRPQWTVRVFLLR
jgi:hypothetical protein